MKYIEKLLQGAEVEWTTLGDEKFIEIANTSRRPVKASNRIAGNTPYYGANNIQDYVEGYTHDGTYVLVAEDGTTSVENYSVQWATGKFWANNHVHVLRGTDRVNSRFLFHYLRIVDFAPFLTGGGRAKLTKKDLIRIPIPIPPLHVQQEIVRILDKFTELETELEAKLETELELRKQQYERYRDQLLSPDKGLSETEVEWKKLGEVAEISAGNPAPQSKDLYIDGIYPFCRTSDVGKAHKSINFYQIQDRLNEEGIKKLRLHKKETILLPKSGKSTLLNHRVMLAVDSYVASHLATIYRKEKMVLARYLFYILSEFDVSSLVPDESYPSLTLPVIANILIPIPPLHVQQEIVRILDKFTELETELEAKLETELELRKQQYAYYRDQLLSFKR